ncbi:hypothetical protein I8751_06560 [Nostocaceae cyanobacterium CENA357]|uniref:Uncharacterized protein n=1 Tax=Atlanticothrix silvestris CENA357 TaxID=1725252 RepID=A0A8J7HG84_9CYAN|nr:hypothetical protein [Atlanticothrix silvestris]MBH8552040.1 hypothetical protein [Atlanticothrix silvestris CENA357]
MSLRRWWKSLHFLGLEFWLPLPILGIFFWLSGNLLAEHLFNRPYSMKDKLQADSLSELQKSIYVMFIYAEVNKSAGITKVTVKTTDSYRRNLFFELPVTNITQIEIAIAQKLGISIEDIRNLARYQIND